MQTTTASNDLSSEVYERALHDALGRAATLCVFMAISGTLYGFACIHSIRKYISDYSLWENVWPRLFITLGLLTVALYIKKSTRRNLTKFVIFALVYPVLVQSMCWVGIVPIAISKNSDILAYVNGGNVYAICVSFVIVTAPLVPMMIFAASLFLFFVVPVALYPLLLGDFVIFNMTFGDVMITFSTTLICSIITEKTREKLIKYELEKEREATKFLGPIVSRAIFKNDRAQLTRTKLEGLIISIDIRDSTNLQKHFNEKWLEFRNSYFSIVSRTVIKHGGYLQKTVGDCHIINFGVMEYESALIENPDFKVVDSDGTQLPILRQISKSAFSCIDEIFSEFLDLVTEMFPDDDLRLGAGVDRGMVERGVSGHENFTLELDVNGDAVNCAARLQEYSKSITHLFSEDSSLVVISPSASRHILEYGQFKKVHTKNKPVRNYDDMEWVLVRAFSRRIGSLERETASLVA